MPISCHFSHLSPTPLKYLHQSISYQLSLGQMSFVSLFKSLSDDYHYFQTLIGAPFPLTHSKSIVSNNYKDKQTDRTLISERQSHFDNPTPRENSVASFQPHPIPTHLHFEHSLDSSYKGVHLAQIQINLDNQIIPYNIYSDTSTQDILDFVHYNLSSDYHQQMIGVISREVGRATKKLREQVGQKMKKMRKESREERDKENREKENTGSIDVVKGEKRVRVGFNDRNMESNLGKMGITNKWSDKEKRCILRAIKKGDREVAL